ncbi:MAG: Gfo/Idh/MocA family oxidoreductase [Candidatus Omnitrophota bacterium]
MKNSRTINLGVIGYGYWGPNIARNLQAIEEADLIAVCDKDIRVLSNLQKKHPNIKVSHDYRDIVLSPDIDAVAVVTPVSTHFELVKAALLNGKHVFVEKPFTSSVKEAEKLIDLANKKKCKIMVDHTFLFTGAVKKIKELIDAGSLGNILYYDSTRINLGLFQHDVNVIWDLIPHDLAVMDFVIKNKPIAVSAQGVDHFGRGLENIAYVTVYFENNTIAHFSVNWLSPVKVRLVLVGGTKKMIAWDDGAADEKVRVYNKGVKTSSKKGVYNLLVDYRLGDMWAPKIDRTEALKCELEYFIRYIASNIVAVNDGHAGLRIVKMLQAANDSLKKGGKTVKL